jgi:hypothetical protein
MLEPSTMWHSMRVYGQQPSGAEKAAGKVSVASGVDAVARKGTMGMVAPRLAMAAAMLCAVGCSDLDPANQTYEQVYNPLTVMPENWRCLDTPPPPVMPTKATMQYTAFVPDYRTLLPVAFDARACNTTDFMCPAGVAQGSMTLLPISPVPGFTVTVPAQFEGFVRLTAPGYLTFDYYIGGAMVEDRVATQAFSMVSETSAGEFLTGLTANPAESAVLGILAVQVMDCNQDFAPGVTLHLPDAVNQPTLRSAQPFATQGRVPVLNAATDEEGIAGFINLPSVNLQVEAEVLGRRFGARAFPIRPGRLTSGTIRPHYVSGY